MANSMVDEQDQTAISFTFEELHDWIEQQGPVRKLGMKADATACPIVQAISTKYPKLRGRIGVYYERVLTADGYRRIIQVADKDTYEEILRLDIAFYFFAEGVDMNFSHRDRQPVSQSEALMIWHKVDHYRQKEA